MKNKDIKISVKEKYDKIAQKSNINIKTSCCDSNSCCDEFGFSMIGDEYNNIDGHNPDADLGLGCGIPTEFANIKMNDSLLDLGSGAGNDCFVARSIVGEKGKVVGLDFSDEMLAKANQNVSKLGYTNISFVKGDIEDMPLDDNQFDVVISNCVLNLVPEKKKAFAEIMRVLNDGGHFCVSDVVIKGVLPEKLRYDAEMYAGCISGAENMDKYLEIIHNQGFKRVIIHKQKEITIPENILAKYISITEIEDFKNGNTGIFSITVSAYKE